MAKGSIEKRGENTWRLTVDLGYHADGTRNRPRKPIVIEDKALLKTTKRLQDYLDDQLAAFKQEVLSGNYIAPAKMTFKDFMEKSWLPKYAEDPENLSPKSLINYKGHLYKHIIPVIGHHQVDEITTMQLVNMMDAIKKPGGRKDGKGDTLAPGTVKYIHRAVKNVFQRAVDWKLLKENPMIGVPKPSEKVQAENFYDEDEAQQVINALYAYAPVKWRLYYVGVILGGFRRGEMNAMSWDDVDFIRNALRVDESISLTRDSIAVVGAPKTTGSKAWVDMPEWYMEELFDYRGVWEAEKTNVGSKWVGGDKEYIFHGGYGKPYYYSYPYRRWADFLKAHNLRHIPLHGLRHTTATILLENEADMKIIQGRLRHLQPSTTSGLYAHVTKKLSRVAADKFNKFNPHKEDEIENSVPNLSPNDENTEIPTILH